MHFLFLFLLTVSVATAGDIFLEAENATLYGLTKSTSCAGYSGTGYVTGFDNDGDKLEFSFNGILFY